MTVRKKFLAGAVLLVAVAALWLAWPDLIAREAEDTALDSSPERIAAGEYLVRAGNCLGCHTRPGGEAFAGGRSIRTPFGDVYSTNLTPDPETGLGNWTTADFWRALHHGRSKEGRRLYPAFPYPSYTYVTRQDADAIFAYLKSLEPIRSPRIGPALRFPYNSRLALMVWRALYFRPGELELDAERSDEWKRGAYLVEALGHCSACHSPRDPLGGIDPDAAFAGGELPEAGWEAPPLNPLHPLTDADAEDLATLLATGVSKRTAFTGPMAEVVLHSLQYLTEPDIRAIVEYLRTLPAAAPAAPSRRVLRAERYAEVYAQGGRIYQQHCADCHGATGEGEPYVYPPLAGNALVTAPSPTNLIRNVMLGGFPPSTAGNPRPYGMPPFAHELRPDDAAAVLTYIRSAWGNAAPPVIPGDIERR